MADDETEIRQLIERWAKAVHDGDLAGVLADHSPDIVMFDVPPPHQGVRGIDAYREVWPAFFEWQRGGAVFEIAELDITAGADVAFAQALLRCDTLENLARKPGSRLRLTIGLRKVDGRWQVTHEHHSFPLDLPADGEAEVRAVHEKWADRTAAKDLDGLMENIDPDVVSYEHAGPLQYVGRDAVREVCREGLAASAGAVSLETPDLTVRVDGDLAVSWGLDHVSAAGSQSWSRATRVFHKDDGEWRMIHQHLSFPLPEQ
ncbi:MAG TPA: nuclear transport factor 2 family protein [Pseudonocardiaceae bacterium]|nr:nuclear transport factor 2 family protein [Pseudonocardiaceae bacterium]